MKTLEQILSAIESGERNPQSIDRREFSRLCDYLPVEKWGLLGFELKGESEPPTPKALTQETVLKDLTSDLAFAFEKAIDKRGLSSSSMYHVIKTWLWVLDDPLQDFEDYAQYGLPLYKAVALKYGLPNEIGDDSGTEHKYSTYGG